MTSHEGRAFINALRDCLDLDPLYERVPRSVAERFGAMPYGYSDYRCGTMLDGGLNGGRWIRPAKG